MYVAEIDICISCISYRVDHLYPYMEKYQKTIGFNFFATKEDISYAVYDNYDRRDHKVAVHVINRQGCRLSLIYDAKSKPPSIQIEFGANFQTKGWHEMVAGIVKINDNANRDMQPHMEIK